MYFLCFLCFPTKHTSCASPQDAWTPLKVAGAVAVINLAGDYYLIIQKGLGVVGAGITCPVAQYFGAIVFMVYLHRMGQREKGIPLSWQVKVTAQYFRLYELLQDKLQVWPNKLCQVSCMSLQLCANTACWVLSSLCIEPLTYGQKQSFTVCCEKAKITKTQPFIFQCACSPREFKVHIHALSFIRCMI